MAVSQLLEADNGFACKIVGFSCNQEQVVTRPKIEQFPIHEALIHSDTFIGIPETPLISSFRYSNEEIDAIFQVLIVVD